MHTFSPDATSAQHREADALFGAATGALRSIGTPGLITLMLESSPGISDLIFSPARPPQVERDLIGDNEHALRTLKEQGACDSSYAISGRARFRVNVFRQRGTFAAV